MTEFGFFLSGEEHAPRTLVEVAAKAERAGFAHLWISDHFHPWNEEQGESAFIWSVLGGIAATTERMRVTTAVTCPIMRIHPAVLAQAAATTQALFEGRFRFGVGSGEALNEHVLGDAWPGAETRLEMLEEAIAVMRELWTGELVRHRGEHFTVDTARIYSLPADPIEVLVSGFGPKATALAARVGDGYMTVDPDTEMVTAFRDGGGGDKVVQGAVKVCWAQDEGEARRAVHRLWPNEALEGEALQVLTSPQHFTQLTDALVDEDTAVAAVGALGPKVDGYVEAVAEFVDAGFDEVYLSQIGPDQDGFLDFWRTELQPALAELG
jgi:G6PDH family F420-dependent oxidoreductase